MNQSADPFDGSRIWKRYERLFESAREARSQRALDSLESKIDSLSDDLASVVSRPPLAAALELVLRSELERGRDRLGKTRGEPEEPDAVLILRAAVPRLDADREVVEALLDTGAEHPWALRTFSTSLAQSLATVQDQVRLVEESGRAAEATDLLAEAESKLAPARAAHQRVADR